ncbi:MAG TPA: glycosyltransferase, partial [Segetibacter sp.]
MDQPSTPTSDLVSVIIPCYNQGKYLAEAIQSILVQTYKDIEIIVVDDGSTDNTRDVATSYTQVKYVYQQNRGLSAARNCGIRNSTGGFLVFLDSDDLLYDHTVSYNINCLNRNESSAFVSGGYDVISFDNKKIGQKSLAIETNHYVELLKSNYIGMHATVMYRRFVFEHLLFDEKLKACEDYDLYLKIARKFPVMHQAEKLAAYRMHNTNMSSNSVLMLTQVLLVLERQKPLLQSETEKKAYRQGIRFAKYYYGYQLFYTLRVADSKPSPESIQLLKKYKPELYIAYLLTHQFKKRSKLKKLVLDIASRLLHRIGLNRKYTPRVGRVQTGDFKRTSPFSDCFGFDRGTPVDRYYVEKFLALEAKSISGHVLEIGDNDYTVRYGGGKVSKSDVLHINDKNPNATIIGDLSYAPQIPDNT